MHFQRLLFLVYKIQSLLQFVDDCDFVIIDSTLLMAKFSSVYHMIVYAYWYA